MNKRIDFLSPVSSIAGIGNTRYDALCHSGIRTVGDLLYYLPQKYSKKAETVTVRKAEQCKGVKVSITGTVIDTAYNRQAKLFIVYLQDINEDEFELLWFGKKPYISSTFRANSIVTARGSVTIGDTLQIIHPDIVRNDAQALPDFPVIPHYTITTHMKMAGITQNSLRKSIWWLFVNQVHFPERLPAQLNDRYQFPPLYDSLKNIHFPQENQDYSHWIQRLKYEELYQAALNLRWMRRGFALPGRRMVSTSWQEAFMGSLPFELTLDQRSVIATLRKQSEAPSRMNTLLQGDVGSGKTVVAFTASLAPLESGYQVVWIAPTELLAMQTYNAITEWLKQFSMKPELITGATPTSERRKIHRGITIGEIQFIIGTHSLLQDSVKFSNPGMIIIDEQQRFGAQQRVSIQHKAPSADFLMLTATPIPQTLAETLYSDLSPLTIQNAPAQKATIKTRIIPESKCEDMYNFILRKVQESDQVYWIVPRINARDSEQCLSIQTQYEKLLQCGFTENDIAIVHGEMPSDQNRETLELFRNGDRKVLLATTIVEVGISIPNATIMVIEQAELFGLSQLHQLRGRVGRGTKESWVFLPLCDSISENTRNRIDFFAHNSCGFSIAEYDLQNRGSGELIGNKQSGLSELQFSSIPSDLTLFQQAIEDVEEILAL